MRKAFFVLLVGSMLAVAFVAPGYASGSIDADAEHDSLQRLNAERQARGLPALRVDADLVSVARDHSRDMASDGELRHNDRLPSQVDGWAKLGENVGSGASADAIHDAFMDSEHHRANILDRDFTRIGIGVVRDGDVVWLTQVFMKPQAAATSTTTRTRPRSTAQTPSRTSPPEPTSTPAPRSSAPVAVRAASGPPVRAVAPARAPVPSADRTVAILDRLTATDDGADPELPDAAARGVWI